MLRLSNNWVLLTPDPTRGSGGTSTPFSVHSIGREAVPEGADKLPFSDEGTADDPNAYIEWDDAVALIRNVSVYTASLPQASADNLHDLVISAINREVHLCLNIPSRSDEATGTFNDVVGGATLELVEYSEAITTPVLNRYYYDEFRDHFLVATDVGGGTIRLIQDVADDALATFLTTTSDAVLWLHHLTSDAEALRRLPTIPAAHEAFYFNETTREIRKLDGGTYLPAGSTADHFQWVNVAGGGVDVVDVTGQGEPTVTASNWRSMFVDFLAGDVWIGGRNGDAYEAIPLSGGGDGLATLHSGTTIEIASNSTIVDLLTLTQYNALPDPFLVWGWLNETGSNTNHIVPLAVIAKASVPVEGAGEAYAILPMAQNDGIALSRSSTHLRLRLIGNEFGVAHWHVGEIEAPTASETSQPQTGSIVASATLVLYSSGASLNAAPTATWGDGGLSGVASPWFEDPDDIASLSTRQIATAVATNVSGDWSQTTWYVRYVTNEWYFGSYEDAQIITGGTNVRVSSSRWQRIREPSGAWGAPIPLQSALFELFDWVSLGRINLNESSAVTANPVLAIDPALDWDQYREIRVVARYFEISGWANYSSDWDLSVEARISRDQVELRDWTTDLDLGALTRRTLGVQMLRTANIFAYGADEVRLVVGDLNTAQAVSSRDVRCELHFIEHETNDGELARIVMAQRSDAWQWWYVDLYVR